MEPAAPRKAGQARSFVNQQKSSSYTEADESTANEGKPQEIATKEEDDLCKRDLPDDLMRQDAEDTQLGQVWEYDLVELESDSDEDCELDPELVRSLDWFRLKTVPDWDVKKVSWEEHVVNMLHMVRLHEITEYDPVRHHPVITRFCQFNLAYFDLDKESRAMCGLPLCKLTSYEHNDLEESINVVSLRIVKSDVGYPIRVFGTVLARDQVDYKCVYLFRRDEDNPQVINSPLIV
ncbi:hypothetical protein PR202_gb23205 [Eleusine coracana subsp. coracana]|uniref:DUF6598 domain-containing protein n=1 Tax=Eleusine coracana subsp. coracana TaxID=191504 RepID=A0AAV5FIB3_ELECO|nr:hypothetical protein PR202_gb23205 [Eleusine coracana subsp. coracana]